MLAPQPPPPSTPRGAAQGEAPRQVRAHQQAYDRVHRSGGQHRRRHTRLSQRCEHVARDGGGCVGAPRLDPRRPQGERGEACGHHHRQGSADQYAHVPRQAARQRQRPPESARLAEHRRPPPSIGHAPGGTRRAARKVSASAGVDRMRSRRVASRRTTTNHVQPHHPRGTRPLFTTVEPSKPSEPLEPVAARTSSVVWTVGGRL
mmetsp:Transcript_48944/g.138217  ORF Transcript_48944/g.138217 Transcript_48944/m.138217 type:complete len:204 (+) Transcript_48944:306-917(+)